MSAPTLRILALRLRPVAVLAAVLVAASGLVASEVRAGGDREARRSPIVRAVERSRAAIVSIHTTQVLRRNWYGIELPPVEGKGIGSGAIFHPEGYVITNAHVVARAREVLVDLISADGEPQTHDARIFAVDLPNDLAILRLLPNEGEQAGERRYPYLQLESVNDLMVGETVIALGNPFGMGLTVTTGVIGGLDRTLRTSRQPVPGQPGRRAPDTLATGGERVFDDFIQIDAAINPGNSGGPLLDVTGRWIGVNTAIWNRRLTVAEGVGFAIPIDRVRSLVGRALKRRLVRGDWLGVEFEEGSGGTARVRHAFPKGPGYEGGLREGDEVLTLDGRPTPTLFDLRSQLAFLPREVTVRLGVRRDGRVRAEPLPIRLRPVPTDRLSAKHLGFVAADVSDKENREQRLAFDAGVVVRTLLPESPAARIGLEAGDLVVGLGTYRIRHSDDLLLFLQYVEPGDLVQVKVLRPLRLRSGRFVREEKAGLLVAE